MTLDRRLSKLEASISPEVRPPKVAVIKGYRDGEDMDAARIATSQPIPRTGCHPPLSSSERCHGRRRMITDRRAMNTRRRRAP